MTDHKPGEKPDPYAAFRVNLEQQQKRAKDLLKAAKAGDASALRRMQMAGFAVAAAFKLAQAQHCIAKELRFTNWAALKRHAMHMDFARTHLGAVLDADRRTLHIRCGHDIRQTLLAAGFHGTFTAHLNPYLEGPVTDTPDWLELRAHFLADGAGQYMDFDYDRALAACREEERQLHASREYPRVMLWLEHDRYDQFVLLRCLAFYAEHGAPPLLERVCVNDFPGSSRFVGLGQLPPEALQLLWAQRARVSAEQLRFALDAWNRFRASDPRKLAELARTGTPLLPDLAPALRRHLQELPSTKHGLGLTQQMLLETLNTHGPQRAGRLVGLVMQTRDPLPGLGDLGYDQLLRTLAAVHEPLLTRSGNHAPREWHLDEIAITEAGRSVLAGQRNWLDFAPPERWVGGVHIASTQRNWYWDDPCGEVVKR